MEQVQSRMGGFTQHGTSSKLNGRIHSAWNKLKVEWEDSLSMEQVKSRMVGFAQHAVFEKW